MHCSGKCAWLHWLTKILLIIGGLNWGLVGIWNLDLVQELFGGTPVVAQIIYILVGASALYTLIALFACKGHCCSSEK